MSELSHLFCHRVVTYFLDAILTSAIDVNFLSSVKVSTSFARVCNHVTDFNARNKCLTAKLLKQGYRYHKLRKTFSTFYRRHYELISKHNVGLKTLFK